MRRLLAALAISSALSACAYAQTGTPLPVIPGYNAYSGCPSANLTPCFKQNVSGNASYPPGSTPIVGSASGSTGAVAGSLAAAIGQFTYICGFQISCAGGTSTCGPATVSGLASQFNFQLANNASGVPVNFSQTFWPCIPSSAVNTAINVATTANGTATAVDVQAWGYQQ